MKLPASCSAHCLCGELFVSRATLLEPIFVSSSAREHSAKLLESPPITFRRLNFGGPQVQQVRRVLRPPSTPEIPCSTSAVACQGFTIYLTHGLHSQTLCDNTHHLTEAPNSAVPSAVTVSATQLSSEPMSQHFFRSCITVSATRSMIQHSGSDYAGLPPLHRNVRVRQRSGANHFSARLFVTSDARCTTRRTRVTS